MLGYSEAWLGERIASLVEYHAPPQKCLRLFIIPEFIGFAYMHRFDGILLKVTEE